MGAATVQLLGTALKVAGTIKQAQGASNAAKYNAAVNDANAALALQQGEQLALQTARIGSRTLGSMRAGYGASGVRTDTGSPLDALAASAGQAQLDVENVRYNALLKSRGLSNSADLDRARAANASRTGLYSAAGQALLGGGKAYEIYTSGAGTPIPVYGYEPPPAEEG